MFNPFKLLTECKDRAMKAMEQGEVDASIYHGSCEKNSDAHEVLMEKIDRRTQDREVRA